MKPPLRALLKTAHSAAEHATEVPCEELALSCLAVVVVDRKLQIKFSFFKGATGEKARYALCESETELRLTIATLVSPLLGSPRVRTVFVPTHSVADALPLGICVMPGSRDGFYALVVETDNSVDSISRAAARFALTRRQTEVLVLVLEGASAGEIAQSLSISEYTAQGYLKSLLSKTGARNRADMASRVLAWRRYETADRSRERADLVPRYETISS